LVILPRLALSLLEFRFGANLSQAPKCAAFINCLNHPPWSRQFMQCRCNPLVLCARWTFSSSFCSAICGSHHWLDVRFDFSPVLLSFLLHQSYHAGDVIVGILNQFAEVLAQYL
jgi:hypothetical protein